jgi:integrase
MDSCSNPAPNTAPSLPQERIHGLTKLKPRLDRPSPYGVQWFVDGAQKREYFRDEDARDTRYNDLTKAGKRGMLGDELTRSEKIAARAFFDAIGDTPWHDVVAGWRENQEKSGVETCTKTVERATVEYLAHVKDLLAAGEISKDTECHKRKQIGRFAQTFGPNMLDEVTAEDIESWIDELGFPSSGTFNSYRKQIRSFFEHHRKQVKNPVDEIKSRSDAVESVGILEVPQAAALFEYARNKHPEALGRLALEAFAGLRFSSALRLEKSDINFEDKGILLPAHKIKTGRRHYIDGLPENLWPWLKKTNDACWALSNTSWMHLKSRLFVGAGVPHPRNCLRHSFCTYHVAAHKNPGLTATILCHRNQQKLWSNYYGVATNAEGLRYFTITPATAKTIAESARAG